MKVYLIFIYVFSYWLQKTGLPCGSPAIPKGIRSFASSRYREFALHSQSIHGIHTASQTTESAVVNHQSALISF